MTNPPHMILESKDLNNLDLEQFVNRGDIESAEFRAFSLQRIEVLPGEWIPLWLFGVADFNQVEVANFFHEDGQKIPAPGSMLVERNGLLISNISLDSEPQVRIRNQRTSIPVSGICFDPSLAPATQDAFIYAFVDQDSYTRITGLNAQSRVIVRLNDVNSIADVRAKANLIVADLNATGITLDQVRIPKFNEHPHQWQLDTLMLLIGSIGLLAFLMAAVLVSQLIKSIISRHVRQIGILKAVGATKQDIFYIYILMLLILGFISGIIAIPLASVTGFAYAYFVAGILNFDVITASLPHWIYLAMSLISLFLPVLLSLSTLLKASNTSVHTALSDYGIDVDISINKSLNRISHKLANTYILAIRNSVRNRSRLIVTVMAMALGVAIFSTGFNVRQSLAELLANLNKSLNFDVQIVLKGQMTEEAARAPFADLPNVKRIESWAGGRGRVQSKVFSTATGVGIVALPYDTDLQTFNIVKGRWLRSQDQLELVMNQQAWQTYSFPDVGSMVKLTIAGKSIEAQLVGIAKQFDVAKIYMDITKYDALFNPEHLINSLMIEATDQSYEQVVALKNNIEKAIVPSELSVLYVMSQAERVKIIYDHLNIILTVIVFLSLLVLIVSAIGMASATSINVMERTREIGVMRAIGATPQKIYQIFVGEGLIVSLISIILGLLISYPLSQAAAVFFGELMLGEMMALDYAFSVQGFWITLITTLIFSWIASRIPARGAIKLSTREALSYE